MLIGNVRKGIITTIIGSCFLVASLVYFIYPMFSPDFVVDSVVLIVSSTIGLGLLVAPDDLFKRLKEKL